LKIPYKVIGDAEMTDDRRVDRKLPYIAAFEIKQALKNYCP
jgi:hypothetical protein